MGRGFGRGAKSVAIVTHAQVKASKKMPRGLRGSRKKRRRQYQKSDAQEQEDLERSLGMTRPEPKSRKTLAQEIASIQVPHMINKRQKGMKALRRKIIAAVKKTRRRHAEKAKKSAKKSRKAQ